MLEPQYIGDGVYAAQSPDFSLVLTTGSHRPEEADNKIFFEPETLDALESYIKRIKEQRSNDHPHE